MTAKENLYLFTEEEYGLTTGRCRVVLPTAPEQAATEYGTGCYANSHGWLRRKSLENEIDPDWDKSIIAE